MTSIQVDVFGAKPLSLRVMVIKQTFHKINRVWLKYEYKHTTTAIVVAILFVAFLDSTLVTGFLNLIERLGYFGAFMTGILSVSFFTTAPAIVLLVELAHTLDPIALAIVAGAGAMIGDWLLLLFFEEKILQELRPLLRKLHVHEIVARLRYRYTSWILVVVGAISLATPVPDEIGIALLGVSHFKPVYVLGICFLLNTLGILGIVVAARTFVP